MTDKEFMRRLAPRVADLLPVQENETFDAYSARVRAEPVEGARALIAAAWLDVSKEIAADQQAVKAEWISNARRSFVPGARQNCIICGKYRYLSHAHHVYPLAEQYDQGVRIPDQRHVWLCPNHHAMVHLLLDGEPDRQTLGRKAANAIEDLDKDELRKVMSLLGRNIPSDGQP